MLARMIFILICICTMLQSIAQISRLDPSQYFKLNIKLYHYTNDSSIIFSQIPTAGLLKMKVSPSSTMSARYSLTYQLMYSDSTSEIKIQHLDSVNYKTQTYYFDSLKFACPTSLVSVDIILTDLNRNTSIKRQILTSKVANKNSHYFNFLNLNGEPLCTPYPSNDDELFIQTSISKQTLLKVYFYKNKYQEANLPHTINPPIVNEWAPDSVFIVKLNQQQGLLKLKSWGTYVIKPDTAQASGCILYKFHTDFPYVTNVNQLLFPLTYITTKPEYLKLKDAENLKTAIDNFWVENATSHDMARRFIQKYYTRIHEANMQFSSYKEGWKTDRGMIYTVMGAASNIINEGDDEVWYYGESNNLTTLRFKFIKQTNPISNNDYMLEHSVIFKNPWYNAVKQWRN